MKRFSLATLAVFAVVGANAQNGAVIKNEWNNNIGNFSSDVVWPTVHMRIESANQGSAWGDRYSWWLSNDGGATRMTLNGKTSFKFGFDLTLDSDAAANTDTEAGMYMEYLNKSGFVPTSQYYAKFNPTAGTSWVATTGDWTMPDYSFSGAQGATYTKGQTVRMELEYIYNDAIPAQSRIRLKYGALDSGILAVGWGGPFDQDMNFGGYFQVVREGGNPGRMSDAVFSNISYEVVPEPATLTALALGAGVLIRRRRK